MFKFWSIAILLIVANISLAADNIMMGEKQPIMPIQKVAQPVAKPTAQPANQQFAPQNNARNLAQVPQRTINGNVAQPRARIAPPNNNPQNVNRPIPRKRVPANRRGLMGKPPSNIPILNADGSVMNSGGNFNARPNPNPQPSNKRNSAFDGKNTTTPAAVSKYHSGDVFLFGLKYSFFDVDDAYINDNPSNDLVDFDIGSGYSFYITSGSDTEIELQTEFSYRNAESNYGDVAIAAVLLNVVYNFDWDIYVRPFITVGSGLAFNLDSADHGFHDLTVPYQYGVGVRFDLDDIVGRRSAIFVSYENFGLLGEGVTLSQNGFDRKTAEYDSSSLVIGLEWSF